MIASRSDVNATRNRARDPAWLPSRHGSDSQPRPFRISVRLLLVRNGIALTYCRALMNERQRQEDVAR